MELFKCARNAKYNRQNSSISHVIFVMECILHQENLFQSISYLFHRDAIFSHLFNTKKTFAEKKKQLSKTITLQILLILLLIMIFGAPFIICCAKMYRKITFPTNWFVLCNVTKKKQAKKTWFSQKNENVTFITIKGVVCQYSRKFPWLQPDQD